MRIGKFILLMLVFMLVSCVRIKYPIKIIQKTVYKEQCTYFLDSKALKGDPWFNAPCDWKNVGDTL